MKTKLFLALIISSFFIQHAHAMQLQPAAAQHQLTFREEDGLNDFLQRNEEVNTVTVTPSHPILTRMLALTRVMETQSTTNIVTPCALCLEEKSIDQTVILPCAHTFCTPCLTTQTQTDIEHRNDCGICRHPLAARHSRPLREILPLLTAQRNTEAPPRVDAVPLPTEAELLAIQRETTILRLTAIVDYQETGIAGLFAQQDVLLQRVNDHNKIFTKRNACIFAAGIFALPTYRYLASQKISLNLPAIMPIFTFGKTVLLSYGVPFFACIPVHYSYRNNNRPSLRNMLPTIILLGTMNIIGFGVLKPTNLKEAALVFYGAPLILSGIANYFCPPAGRQSLSAIIRDVTIPGTIGIAGAALLL